ncbi:MAG: hypothetical protein ACTHJR_18125 [Sphingomonas sp.]|uniref:hypothetical protein n=1 Tax=Sphingomonas sp. TaxID=28214 RepID=UPI003F808BEE
MDDEYFITLTFSNREAGRLLAGLRERKRKIEKQIKRRGDDFDPELGKGAIFALDQIKEITDRINKALDRHRDGGS